MSDFFFISHSSLDTDFAIKLADTLAQGPPPVPVWLEKRALHAADDWDDQLVEAIRTCKGLIFIMTPDSVRPGSGCKDEWVRALNYKKPVIPLVLDPAAELPYRLGSRQCIDFSRDFSSALAALRNHFRWMDSPEGQLQVLKHQLSDAQRDLLRANPEQQARIKDDIAELERQIAQQQKVIDNPKAAEERVQKSIDAGLEGERQPAKPVSGISTTKFINPPPMIPPTWFQDRIDDTGQIGAFLKDESLRLMAIVGRGGVGKTAMVCRVLRSLEGGRLPDNGEALTVDGIVYLSAARSFHKTNVPDLYASLVKLLSDETVKQLDAVYKNPQSSTRATMEALAQAFPRGRTVVLLDNFEEMLEVETGTIKDAELDEALRALLELPPHGLRIIITTRVAPGDLAMVQPGLQRRLDLDKGLDHPFAEEILRSMDYNGKVGLKDAPDSLLDEARKRTLGYPRALEHLFSILSADRNTSLQEILDNTRELLPEKVVEVLVGEAFSRLDLTAQRVMQALATYRYPVPPAAVDYLLQPYVAGIDSGRVLGRLVNMQFARRDAGRYYLHQVDRDYAVGRIAEGNPSDRDAEVSPLTRFALRHRAAEWFKLSRKPREAWKTLDDLAAQLSEFELRCDGADYDTAAALLLEFDFAYLFLWGHYRLMSELHERLQEKIADPDLMQSSAANLGSAYFRMGVIHKAVILDQKALDLARQGTDRWAENTFLYNLATDVAALGQNAQAIGYLDEVVKISRDIADRKLEAFALGTLGVYHAEIGETTLALDYVEQALAIDREIEDHEGEAVDLSNLGAIYRKQGNYDQALRTLKDSLTAAFNIGYRLIEAESHGCIGDVLVARENWKDATAEYAQMLEIADDIGSAEDSRDARESLAFVHLNQNDPAKAREMIEAARKYDVPLANHSTSAMLGLVALRQGDLTAAKDAFTSALKQASELIALTAERYEALDTEGLSSAGLALCGDPTQIPTAKVAYKAARAVTSDAGIVRNILQRFDALAQADKNGILADVRPVAAGTKKI